jgi:flagellar biosynthetic protein FliO
MKFIRNARLRDRIVDFVSKALLIGISLLVCLWMISGARAANGQITGIKGSSLQDGAYAVDFSLSQHVEKDAVEVEFERNFIQVSFRGLSAYPARTENINTALLEKVFTYQYQPDLARARVLLKSQASTVKDKTSWELTKDGLRLIVKGAGTAAPGAAASGGLIDADDEKLVKEIIEKGTSISAAPMKKPAESLANIESQPVFSSGTSAEKSEGRAKETTATKVVASLLLVIGIIGATAVAFRRFVLGKGISFQRNEKVIQVVASQALGPKRSIAVVKVLDQYMVVGMAGDGMNLLANLGADVNVDRYLDQAGPGVSFGDAFDSALVGGSGRNVETAGPVSTQRNSVDLGIRASIKKRIEGFKPL